MKWMRDYGTPANADSNAAESRAAYREESNRFVLTNPLIRLAISSVNGTILSLQHRETKADFIDAEEAAVEGCLWELDFLGREEGRATVTSRDCVEFAHSLGRHRHRGNIRLWLQWTGFRTARGNIEGTVTVQITFPGDGSAVFFEEEICLPDGYRVLCLRFPCVGSVGPPELLSEDSLFFPLSGGLLLQNPRGLLRPGAPAVWEAPYPGAASMQFFGYSWEKGLCLSLTAHDSGGAQKVLSASGMSGLRRLRLWMTHYPVRRPDGHWSSGYPSAIGLVAGDWFEVAQEYRSWAVEQSWSSGGMGGARHLPALTSADGLWASYWGGPQRCISTCRELQRLVSTPVRLDWRCWHGCERDGAYPDYLPPRDGKDAFESAEAQLGEAGVLDQININALLASTESAIWTQGDLGGHALRPVDGTKTPLAHPVPESMTVMCPGAKCWRELLAKAARSAAEGGADGVLLEDLDGPAGLCSEAKHDHGAPEPGQWTASIRLLLASVRDVIGERRQLAMDGLGEGYLDLVDAFFSGHAAAEREGIAPEAFERRWIPIPLFAAVYHDLATHVGPSLSLGSFRAHDPMWPAASIAELREPFHIMARDYQTQFCLEVGRAMTWGYQPLLENFSPAQLRDDPNRHKMAFLAAALRAQTWGVGALLPHARFLGPLAIDCPAIETDLLVNPHRAVPEERRSFRRSVPAVQGSAWRVPGGGLALVFVNIHTQGTEFTSQLSSRRLGLKLPLRLVGRTFSEDGDVPAASLKASGSEVSGKLPARAIVLVSVR